MSLSELLADAARACDVPGASLAIGTPGDIEVASAGTANAGARIDATPDTVFHLGSITKAYTATLVAQLAADGALALDEPVAARLPEMGWEGARATITVEQLLTHTSGVEGDHILDLGEGEDAFARYVASCGGLATVHGPGERVSYCNAGFVILARLIEIAGGTTWERAIRERILTPLGLADTLISGDEVVLRRAAVGHRVTDAGPVRTDRWHIPWALAPAGRLCATAVDTVRFGLAHLDGEALAAPSAEDMRRLRARYPAGADTFEGFGLGWMLFDWDGVAVFGHDGGTIGQSAFLRVVPTPRAAICLLTNGGRADELADHIFDALADRLGARQRGGRPPVARAPEGVLGAYERPHLTWEIAAADDGFAVTNRATGPLAEYWTPTDARLETLPGGGFRARSAAGRTTLVFDGPADAPPAWLYADMRAHRRRA